jgi:predicted enzyme related to lactoylglutathione lyase
VHLPPHPVWFWLILLAPLLIPLLLWVAVNTLDISIKPLTPWVKIGYIALFIPFILVGLLEDHKTLRVIVQSCFYVSSMAFAWLQRHYMFETLRAPGSKWYFPWKVAGFSVPDETRILVRNIDAVSPWYIEKLGLRKLTENDYGESDVATFRFKQDGNSFVLTTRGGFQTGKTPILFTKRIGKMRDIMMARGVNVGDVKRDRQGIQYFEIRDPEGNEIEVVQER